MTKELTVKEDSTTLECFANTVSAVFHPLILPAVAFTLLIAADSTNDVSRKLIIASIALTFSVILVPGYIFWLKRFDDQEIVCQIPRYV